MSAPSVWESPAPVDDKVRELTSRLGSLRDVRLEYPIAGTVVIVRRTRPAWTIVVAILLFPIGLLALLIKGEQRMTLRGDPKPDGGGSVWTVTGKGDYSTGWVLQDVGVIAPRTKKSR